MLHETVEVGAEVMNILRGAEERAEKVAINPPETSDSGLPAFPEIAWRGRFAEYRDLVRNTTEAADVAHFAAFAATCAVRLGRSIYMHAGDVVYPNVYLCVVGDTGDRKTTAQRRPRALGLLDGVHVIPNVGSPEGLARSLKRDEESGEQRSTALFSWEEFASLLSRARWKASTVLEFFVETFDCPPEWGLEYKEKNKVTVTEPTPSILTGTTSDWFWKTARPDDFMGGFGNRFLFLSGPRKPPLPRPAEADPNKARDLREHLMKLGHQRGAVRFSKDAERTWDAFYIRFEGEERPGLLGAALKRVHMYVRKFAMVYAATEGTLPIITHEQLKAAIAVGLYAAECTKALIDCRNALTRPEAELERRFLEWVGKHDGSKKRYMQQTLSKVAGSCEVFNRTLLNLQRAGHVEIEDGKVYSAR